MMKLLSAKNLSKNYGSLQVLSNISLEVAEGEIVVIVGPSGAGKTTLLHILGTLDLPNPSTKSSLVVAGTDTTKLSEKELASFRNQKMGFIFQFHELLPEFTALENVCLPSWIKKAQFQKVKKKLCIF